VTHADLHAFQRAPRERREPTKREAQRIEKLQTKMQELAAAVDDALDAEDDKKADALQEEAEAKALRTLERLRQCFGGTEAENDDEGEDGDSEGQPKTAAMSDKLAQRLSAHRTPCCKSKSPGIRKWRWPRWCMAWCRPSCRVATTATTCCWA
jgi:ParB family chromosome partitioning protein